jgi:hypothetical protein
MTELPDEALRVETDHDGENYVSFTGTDVIEWYTEKPDGTVQKEQFVATEPDCPEDIEMLVDGDIAVTYHTVRIPF